MKYHETSFIIKYTMPSFVYLLTEVSHLFPSGSGMVQTIMDNTCWDAALEGHIDVWCKTKLFISGRTPTRELLQT